MSRMVAEQSMPTIRPSGASRQPKPYAWPVTDNHDVRARFGTGGLAAHRSCSALPRTINRRVTMPTTGQVRFVVTSLRATRLLARLAHPLVPVLVRPAILRAVLFARAGPIAGASGDDHA